MICVSIGRSRHKHMLAEYKHLYEQGARLVELRLDYIGSRVNIQRLLKDRPCPAIITCRREQDGGKWSGEESARQMLLREAVAMGVDYVDIEDDIADLIPRFGKTKRIISYHNFRNTPDDLREIHTRLASKDADIVKIATMAQHPHDNLRMLEMVQESEVSTVGMCMGDIGTPSRILVGKFGAPFTYATFHHERALAPGQLSFDQMKTIYRYDKIGRDTKVFGVIADPVAHSLSPHVHNAALELKGVDAVYVPFRVPPDALDQFIEDMSRMGLDGLSVTIPHKEAVAKHLTKVDPMVKGIAACNTIVRRGFELHGYNTDCKAAMDCLEAALGGGAPGEKSLIAGKRVLVLGAGGVSRALLYGLRKREAQVTIASRTKNRSDALAEEFGAKAVEWSARHAAATDVIINGTPIGMHPNVDETPINKSYLKPAMVVFDTVYNPESTLLLKEAKLHGCRVVSGVDMFVGQAALQFFVFTSLPPSSDVREAMRKALRREIGPTRD
jgi:3-dehydroquinate dehydratase/shikimate dehydrogenase